MSSLITSCQLTAEMTLLLATFRLSHRADPQACRAADRLLDHLGQQAVTYALDGTTLRVQSLGHEPEAIYTCTLLRCSCRGGRHPWCQHRVLRAVLLAQRALDADLGSDDGPPERIPPFAPPPNPTSVLDPAARSQAFVDITELFG
jgi:hypothetical protein